jgi:hypothetical protein
MAKQIRNLINKYGAETLKTMIDDIVHKDADYDNLKALCSDDAQTSRWFRNWAEKHNLTVKETYNGRRLDIVELPLTGPYVVLWLSRDNSILEDGSRIEPAHFELGESLEKLWSADGVYDLLLKLDRILELRVEETA